MLNSVWGEKILASKEDLINKTYQEVWKENIEKIEFEQDIRKLKAGMTIYQERIVEQVGYVIMKIPIFDEKGQYTSFIGINKYNFFDETSDHIEMKASEDKAFDEEQLGGKIRRNLAENKVLIQTLEAESIMIYRCHSESNLLKGICYLSKTDSKLVHPNLLSIDQNKLPLLLSKNKEWDLEEFEKEDLSRLGIKYVTAYPIKCKGEMIGMAVATYKSKIKRPVYEANLMIELGKHVANLSLSMQHSLDIKRELLMRKEVEERLKLYLSLAVDFITVINMDGKIARWNETGEDVMGWSCEEIAQMTYLDLVHPQDQEKTLRIMNVIVENKEVTRFTNRFRHKDGSYKLITWKCKFDEGRQRIYTIARDITEERKIEEERMIYKEALALETLKTEFLANISHELKTPLNIIYSMLQMNEVEMAELTVLPEEKTKLDNLVRYRNISRQNVLRLLRLINNITDISRIGAGYYEAKLVNCDIVKVIEDITMSVVEYVRNKNLSIIFDTQVEELVTACDPEKMERIMLNLLSNAVKYTNKGDQVEVNVKVKNNELIILVKDTGSGIPKDKQKSIFERFVQVDSSFTRRCEGSGIGLALVKCLIELQHGSISVESEEGQGSTFIVKLPIYQTEKMQKQNIDRSDILMQQCKIEFSDIYNL